MSTGDRLFGKGPSLMHVNVLLKLKNSYVSTISEKRVPHFKKIWFDGLTKEVSEGDRYGISIFRF
jgi:hypothetical protein